MPNLDWAGRPVLASIINRSSFLIGELLLGKLGETVVVHGNAPHDRSRSLVSRLIGNRELPLHESANAQGPRQTFWIAFSKQQNGSCLRCIAKRRNAVATARRPGVGCTDAEMNSSLGTNRRKYRAYMVRGGPKAPAARYIWSLYFRVERVSMIRGFLHQALVMKATRTAPVDKLVVVIDDDPLILEATGGLLQSWGCCVAAEGRS